MSYSPNDRPPLPADSATPPKRAENGNGRKSAWFSIEQKIRIVLVIAGLSLFLVGAFSYSSVIRFRNDAWWVNHSLEVLERLTRLGSSVGDAETAQRNYVITGDEEYLKPYADASREVESELARLRDLIKDNATQRRNLETLADAAGQRLSFLGETVERRRGQGFEAARGRILSGKSKETGEQVLFVDDEALLVSTGKAALERNGYNVLGSVNAEDALKEFQASPDSFDVVITDFSMPAMSGLRFAQELRQTRPDIPIVLTSGYLPPEEQAKAKSLGIRHLVTKPVNTRGLLNVLATIFRERSDFYRQELA